MKYCKSFLALALTIAIAISLVPGVYGKEEAETPEHVHDYIVQVVKEASHTEGEILRYSCTLCSDVYEEEGEPLGHSYVAEIVKPVSCTEDGLTVYTCSCGDSYEEVIKAEGHNYVAESIKDVTCTEDGVIVYICSCGDYYAEVVEFEGHKHVPQVIQEVSCTEDGLTVYTCSCGDTYEVKTPATGHTYTSKVIKKLTCTQDGITLYTCSCGDSYEVVTKTTGHNYVIIDHTEPTQEEDGYTIYACTACHDEYTVTTEHENKFVAKMYLVAKRQVSPLGHMWVYIHNNSNHPIEVGAYTVPVGQGVSVGVFGLTRSDGIGLYYNIEAYAVNKYGIDSVICMQEYLTQDKLEKVSKKVRSSNFWDPMFFNCTGAAFAIWNAGASTTLVPLIFPVFGRLQMLSRPHTEEIDMYYPKATQVFKQRGTGKNARLEQVSEGSISHGV